jgi:hypothetical protein
MAYMDQEKKKRLAALCKTALKKWPGMKWTLSVRHHSTIVMTIQEGDIDFGAEAVLSHYEETSGYKNRLADGYLQVNEKSIERDWKGDALGFLGAAEKALNDGNFDKSDIQSDYFHVGWYVDIQIGRWNKPYRFTGAKPAEAPAEYRDHGIGCDGPEHGQGIDGAELPANDIVERMNEAAAAIEWTIEEVREAVGVHLQAPEPAMQIGAEVHAQAAELEPPTAMQVAEHLHARIDPARFAQAFGCELPKLELDEDGFSPNSMLFDKAGVALVIGDRTYFITVEVER